MLKLIVQLGAEESGGNETVKTLIEKESGSEDAIVNLKDVLPDDRSYFAFEVTSNGKESALRKFISLPIRSPISTIVDLNIQAVSH